MSESIMFAHQTNRMLCPAGCIPPRQRQVSQLLSRLAHCRFEQTVRCTCRQPRATENSRLWQCGICCGRTPTPKCELESISRSSPAGKNGTVARTRARTRACAWVLAQVRSNTGLKFESIPDSRTRRVEGPRKNASPAPRPASQVPHDLAAPRVLCLHVPHRWRVCASPAHKEVLPASAEASPDSRSAGVVLCKSLVTIERLPTMALVVPPKDRESLRHPHCF